MIYQCAVFSVFIAVVAAAASSTGSLVKMADVRKVSKITPEANDGSTVWVKNTFYEDSCSGKTIKTIYYSTSVCWSTDTGSMSFSCDIGGGWFDSDNYLILVLIFGRFFQSDILLGYCVHHNVDLFEYWRR